MGKKGLQKIVYCFDIDGVICTNNDGKYLEALPLYKHIVAINKLKDEGHTIILFTARGSTTGKDCRKLTERQLEIWGVKYDKLYFGKPYANRYIDDRGENSNDFFK